MAGRRRVGKSFRFVELANDINEHMPDYVVRRLIDALNRDGKALRGARVLLLGMAYKRNTGDAREAPSASVAKQLLSYGAEVKLLIPTFSTPTPSVVSPAWSRSHAARDRLWPMRWCC